MMNAYQIVLDAISKLKSAADDLEQETMTPISVNVETVPYRTKYTVVVPCIHGTITLEWEGPL